MDRDSHHGPGSTSSASFVTFDSALAIYNSSTFHIPLATSTGGLASVQVQSLPSHQVDTTTSTKDTDPTRKSGAHMNSSLQMSSSQLHPITPPSTESQSISVSNGSPTKRASNHETIKSELSDVHTEQDCVKNIGSQTSDSSCLSHDDDADLYGKSSSIFNAQLVTPPKKPPRMLIANDFEPDVLNKINDSTLYVRNVSVDGTGTNNESDARGETNNNTRKRVGSSRTKRNTLEQNDCHLVQASMREVPIYCLLHDDPKKVGQVFYNDEEQTMSGEKSSETSQDSVDYQVILANLSSSDSSASVGEIEQLDLIQTNHAAVLSTQQPVYADPGDQKQSSFRVSDELFTDTEVKQSKASVDFTSSEGNEKTRGKKGNETTELDVAEIDKDPSNPDSFEQPILLPSVIAEARLRSQVSMARNRYVFRSPTRQNDFLSRSYSPNFLASENTTFGSLQRKLRNSMRKVGSAKPKALDSCSSSLTLFASNEKEYNEQLAKILASSETYNTVEECFCTVKHIKASSDAVIDYVSVNPLSVTTIIEAFYKHIEQFKHYAPAMKEMRDIEVASYDAEHHDLSSLLEKLVVVNDRIPFYCSTFHSWLQLMPDVDNVDELRNLINLLEQIRLNGLIPDLPSEST